MVLARLNVHSVVLCSFYMFLRFECLSTNINSLDKGRLYLIKNT